MVTWARWAPVYEEILKDFGYDRAEDEAARDELAALLAERDVADPARLRSLLEGEDVVVYGPALDAETDWHYEPRGDVKIATDAATRPLLDRNVVPDVVVTDLDGDVWAHVEANARGAVVIVHAHGDNRPALREWVPRFRGPVIGSTQAEPVPRVFDWGGFTDGDRAVFLADHYRARVITLVGFDFDRPVEKPGKSLAVKRKKLRWARALIGAVDTPVRVPTEGGPFSF